MISPDDPFDPASSQRGSRGEINLDLEVDTINAWRQRASQASQPGEQTDNAAAQASYIPAPNFTPAMLPLPTGPVPHLQPGQWHSQRPVLPDDIHKFLEGPSREELFTFLRWLNRMRTKDTIKVDIATGLGKVRLTAMHCDVTDVSLNLMLPAGGMVFEPDMGAELTMTVHMLGESVAYPVVYGGGLLTLEGLPIVFISFLRNTADMEKNARVELGRTPSVESGLASTHVDDHTGEAVAGTEKSAAWTHFKEADADTED